MYELINKNINPILDSISEKHISDYEWLLNNKHNIGYHFKRRYKSFWQLNAALLSDEFCDEYFLEIQNSLKKGSVDLRDITKKFYDIPSNKKGANKLQFSFCTKLCHVVSPCLPIYDAMVRDFYFFKEPNRKLFLSMRIEEIMYFYDFLVGEYDRIISEKLLENSIWAFYERFNAQNFTTQKVIDSLIWAFIGFVRSGSVVSGEVVFR